MGTGMKTLMRQRERKLHIARGFMTDNTADF